MGDAAGLVSAAAVFGVLCLAVMLKLHESIRVILNNYISAVLKNEKDWVMGAKPGVFAMLILHAVWLPFYLARIAPDFINLTITCIDILVLAISAAALAFLFYENWIMYWRITFKRLVRTAIPALSLLVGGVVAIILALMATQRAGNFIFAAAIGLLAGCLFLLGCLIPQVRAKRWISKPKKSDDWFEAQMHGVYSLARRQSNDYDAPLPAIPIDENYGGEWVLYADIDGDGLPELISARNRLQHDRHDVASVAVQKQDGKLLWHWGNPTGSRQSRSYDLACQVHDMDGDGRLDIIVASRGYVYYLDGRTGTEKCRFAIETRYCDMLMFLDASGIGRKTDILVKDRYHRLWVYTREGKLLYTAKDPGGYMLAHAPLALDLDGDGRDELLAGFAMLDHDGTLLWTHRSRKVALWFGGHADSLCVVRLDVANPANTRLLITYCDAAGIAMVDGNGNCIWEFTGVHFATAAVAKLGTDGGTPQIIVDLGHLPRSAAGEIWILSIEGNHLATIKGSHRAYPVDWDGDGVCELLGIPPHIRNASTGSIPPFAMARDFYRFRVLYAADNKLHDVMKIGGGMALIYQNPARLRNGGGLSPNATGLNVSSYQSV